MSGRGIFLAVIWAMLAAAGAGRTEAQSEAPAGTRFTLSGVVVIEGGGRAWLHEPTLTRNETVAVRPGDSIGPYRLSKILEDRVELEGPTGKFVVLLAGAPGPAVATVDAGPRPITPTPSVVSAPVTPGAAPQGRVEVAPAGAPRVDFESLLRGVMPSGVIPSR